MGKKHGPEEIIGKLREAEIVLAQGGTTGDACRRIAVIEQTYCTASAPMGPNWGGELRRVLVSSQ